MTLLGSRLLLLGGSGPLGPLGDAHLLESPAAQRGLQLQADTLAAQQLLTDVQAGSVKLQAELTTSRHEADHHRTRQEVMLGGVVGGRTPGSNKRSAPGL